MIMCIGDYITIIDVVHWVSGQICTFNFPWPPEPDCDSLLTHHHAGVICDKGATHDLAVHNGQHLNDMASYCWLETIQKTYVQVVIIDIKYMISYDAAWWNPWCFGNLFFPLAVAALKIGSSHLLSFHCWPCKPLASFKFRSFSRALGKLYKLCITGINMIYIIHKMY